MSMLRLAAALSMCVALLGTDAAAKPAKAKRAARRAFIVMTQSGAAVDVVQGFEAAVAEAARNRGIDLLSGAALKRQRPVVTTLEACAGEPGCLTKAARKLKLEEIWHAHARSEGNAVQLVFKAVSPQGVERELSLVAVTADDAKKAVDAQAAKITNVAEAVPPEAMAAAEADPLDLPLEELAPLELAPLPDSPAPAAGAEPAPEVITAAPASSEEPADASVSTSPLPPTAEPGFRWALWGGIGAAVVGAGLVAWGIPTWASGEGERGACESNQVEPDVPGVEMQGRCDTGQANLDLGMYLNISGGVLLGIGLTALIVDLLVLNPSYDADAWVAPTTDGASAGMRFRF